MARTWTIEEACDLLDRCWNDHVTPEEFRRLLMPRKQPLKALGVLEFFRTAPIENARLVLELASGELAARTPKAGKVAATPAPEPIANTAPRRRKPRNQPLPDPGPGAVATPGPVAQVGG